MSLQYSTIQSFCTPSKVCHYSTVQSFCTPSDTAALCALFRTRAYGNLCHTILHPSVLLLLSVPDKAPLSLSLSLSLSLVISGCAKPWWIHPPPPPPHPPKKHHPSVLRQWPKIRTPKREKQSCHRERPGLRTVLDTKPRVWLGWHD